MKSRPLCVLSALLLVLTAAAEPAPLGRVQVVKDQFLPGPELQARHSDGREPIVLRITAVYPQGTAGFRYDITWSALEPGSYDLTKFLEPAAGATPVPLPAISVEAAGVLPAGPPGQLPDPSPPPLPSIGGYRFWLPVGIAVWVLAGAAFFLLTRKRKPAASQSVCTPGQTLAQRLQPLLRRALAGPLETGEKAELERLVIAYGREHLGITGATTPAVWQSLRDDSSTGPWLGTLEAWLHRPSPVPPTDAELEALLSRITSTPAATG
jgi:hypothetical protein